MIDEKEQFIENKKICLKIMRYISSIHFTIPTKEILDLQKQIRIWIETGNCGAIIYGRPRIGKTRAIEYIKNNLNYLYGIDFPIIIWNMTNHTITERNFYASFLMAMGIPDPNKGSTALILKERVLNALEVIANDTEFKKIILFIDEAYLMAEKDFNWLMDLYNNLNLKDIQLTAFLFGSNELKDLKKSLIVQKRSQIIGRFMINEYHFVGIKTKDELSMCLLSFDQPVKISNLSQNETNLLSVFFPEAYKDNHTFMDLSDILWIAFECVKHDYSILTEDIPMKYAIDTIIACISLYGAYGDNPLYLPGKQELIDCIIKSGYPETDEDKIYGCNNKKTKRRQY